MSPEQAEGTDIDARTDIWGLGVLLYEMAAGKQPFEGPTPSHTIVAILEHEPEPFEHPSAELKLIISTALQKDRALRFQSAEAMTAALDELKHRLGYFSDQNIKGPTVEETRPVSSTPSPYRKLLWIVPAAVVILLVSVIGIYALMSLVFSGESAGDYPSANVEPSPTSMVESNTAVVVPTPTEDPSTPAPVYVEPTPEPTPLPPIAVPQATVTPERQKPVVAQTPRPTMPPVPKKTPKPRPKQDPNCVFTNSCN